MTHLQHRLGSVEELEEDWVVFVREWRGDKKWRQQQMRKALEVLWKHNPVNIGKIKRKGYDYKRLYNEIDGNAPIAAVYNDTETVKRVTEELKVIGCSVMISGLFDRLFKASKDLGITPHTCNLSLGIWGKKDLLPKEEILKIVSMCGHGMISVSLVEKMIKDIKTKKISLNQAVEDLALPCSCGVFNPTLAKKILKRLVI